MELYGPVELVATQRYTGFVLYLLARRKKASKWHQCNDNQLSGSARHQLTDTLLIAPSDNARPPGFALYNDECSGNQI